MLKPKPIILDQSHTQLSAEDVKNIDNDISTIIDDNNNRHAFYKGLKTHTYKKTSHLFDQLYIKILIESKQIKLNAK